MKHNRLAALCIAVITVTAANSNGSIILENTATRTGLPGDNYTLSSTDSNVLVVGLYNDSSALVTNITYGGLSPDGFFGGDGGERTSLAYFYNVQSATSTGFTVSGGSSSSAAVIYELSGVDTSILPALQTADHENGRTSTTTVTTAPESFLISVFGEDGSGPTTSLLTAPAGFGTTITTVNQGGSIFGATGEVGPGTHIVEWESSAANGSANPRDGQVTVAFTAASPIPEPSSILLISLLAAGAFGLRLRSKAR